jgi:hypothetical protein
MRLANAGAVSMRKSDNSGDFQVLGCSSGGTDFIHFGVGPAGSRSSQLSSLPG